LETEWFGVEIGLLTVAALFSIFLSAAEIIIFSLSKSAVDRLSEIKPRSGKWLRQLLSTPHRLKATLRIGRVLANVTLIAALTLLSFHLALLVGIPFLVATFLEIFLVAIAVLLLNVFSPTLYVAEHADRLAPRVLAFVLIVHFLLMPLTAAYTALTHWMAERRGSRGDVAPFVEEELWTLIEVGEEKGPLEEEERRMIHSIFEFGETLVKEVMVPRTDMVTVERSISLEQLAEVIRECGHSRIPVYEGRIDHIIGIVHAKDLLIRIGSKEPVTDLAEIVRPAYFVPETKKIDELLREFQRERSHMAIVVDEYGGTAGLVTLEDVIEEIVGEIQDEYDFELPLYRRIDDRTLVVDAKIDLHDLNELLEIDLPTEEGYESLGGFILSLTGYVPAENDVVRYNGYHFVIEKVDGNRIVRVRIVRMPESESDSDASHVSRDGSKTDAQPPFSS
jgi:CBS domain containing-hemolysin-like protein